MGDKKNLGLGVMIGMLAGNKDSAEAFNEAMGKKIKALSLGVDDALHFVFEDDTKIMLFDDGQSCCEVRYMRTDDDLAQFIGSELLDAEIADGPEITDDNPYDQTHETQFLNVKTSLGVFTMTSHNEHNGYYAGFLIRAAEEE